MTCILVNSKKINNKNYKLFNFCYNKEIWYGPKMGDTFISFKRNKMKNLKKQNLD